MNTKYFHLIANDKHRKTRIFQLQDNDKVIEGDEQLKKYATKYYKGLFGSPSENNFSLDESIRDDIPQVTEGENEKLTKPFGEEEVKKAIFDMEHNKVLGPDGFPVKFYQVFWDLIKSDLLAMFDDFHKGELPLYSLNFGNIVLLAKCKEAAKIQ
jgi:hypothetical protein